MITEMKKAKWKNFICGLFNKLGCPGHTFKQEVLTVLHVVHLIQQSIINFQHNSGTAAP